MASIGIIWYHPLFLSVHQCLAIALGEQILVWNKRCRGGHLGGWSKKGRKEIKKWTYMTLVYHLSNFQCVVLGFVMDTYWVSGSCLFFTFDLPGAKAIRNCWKCVFDLRTGSLTHPWAVYSMVASWQHVQNMLATCSYCCSGSVLVITSTLQICQLTCWSRCEWTR